MQAGERPAGCEYCWKIEDMGRDRISDRVDKTRIYTDEELDEAYMNKGLLFYFKKSYIPPQIDRIGNKATIFWIKKFLKQQFKTKVLISQRQKIYKSMSLRY